MGAEVTLVIKADNSQYIQKMKESQQASQKLHDVSIAGEKREKGILEEIDATLTKLNASKRKAFTYEEIEKFNKKIDETKQHLAEYENAGKKATKETESFTQSIGKWALGLGAIATAMNLLKKAFEDTIAGMYAFNIAGAAMKQVLYNIVTGVSDWNQNVAQSIILAKQRNDLLLKDRIEMLHAKTLMREYNELYNQSLESMDDGVKKIAALTAAKKKYTEAIQIEIKSTYNQLELAKESLRIAPLSKTAQDQVIELTGKIQDLYGQLGQGLRRITRQITAEEKQLFTDVFTEIKKFNTDIDKEITDINKEEADKAQKQADKILAIQTKYYKEYERIYKFWADKKKEDADKELTWMDILKARTENAQEFIGDSLDTAAKRAEDLRQDEIDKEKEKNELIKRGKLEAAEQTIQLAQATANLILTISNNQMEAELLALDEKTKKLLLIAELNGATKREELAIYEEAERQKLAIEKKYAKERQKIAIAQATIDAARTIVKIFLEYAGQPIAYVIAAAVAATLAVQIATIKAQKFAKGGWTGEGRERDETGERIAGIVHEKEFVTRKGPASKYREVLEAINRDDKAAIYNSFNKIEPELLGGVTNVMVENSGPNKRLDRINNQLSQLNRTLTPRKTTHEEIMISGTNTVIKKGSNTRIISR